MNVKNIFTTLIIIVVCVVIGAVTLNVLVPNVVTTMVNATEDQIYKATGLAFDFNGDGTLGGSSTPYVGDGDTTSESGGGVGGVGVEGVD